jgi:uncharacterized alpha-E superfamily protein
MLKLKSKKKPPSIAKLRESVAELLQKLVRMKAADMNGYCQCVTCPKSAHWKEMQGGHFIERGRHATELVEENVHPQCPGCNQWGMRKSSVVLTYRSFMVDMYGEQFVEELEIQSKQVAKFSRGYLEDMKADLKKQIAIQEERLAGKAQKQEAA